MSWMGMAKSNSVCGGQMEAQMGGVHEDAKNNCRQLPDLLLMFAPLLCKYLFVLKNEVRQFQI